MTAKNNSNFLRLHISGLKIVTTNVYRNYLKDCCLRKNTGPNQLVESRTEEVTSLIGQLDRIRTKTCENR